MSKKKQTQTYLKIHFLTGYQLFINKVNQSDSQPKFSHFDIHNLNNINITSTLTKYWKTIHYKKEEHILACTVQVIIIWPITKISGTHAHGRLAMVMLLMRIIQQTDVVRQKE